MEDVKRLGLPLLIVVVSACLTQWIQRFITGQVANTLMITIQAIALFIFGMALHGNLKKTSKAVYRKVIAIIIVFILFCMQMNYIAIPALHNLFTVLGLHSIYMHMLYVFCGYVFVD